MNWSKLSLAAGAALVSSLMVAQAHAQNLPPPGNVNPGSLNSGAEQTGAPNQPRSYGNDMQRNYGMTPEYLTPGYELGYGAGSAYGYAPTQRGAPVFGGSYWD